MHRSVFQKSRVLAAVLLIAVLASGCSLDDVVRALARLCAQPVFVVTKTADTNDGLCTGSDCSLREAVVMSNSCPGTQTIRVPSGTYTLTRVGAGEDAAATGDLDITDSVIINGEEMPVVDGNRQDRVFDILAGPTVDITGLVIQHGQSDDGGGIRNRGILRLHASTLMENIVTGTPTGTAAASGGAILSELDGSLAIDGSEVIGNSAYQGGGIAVWANGTTIHRVEISDTVIAENDSDQAGGGLLLGNAVEATLATVILRDNNSVGDRGGGIYNAATLTLTSSSLYGNRGGIYGGAIYNEPAGDITAREVLLQNNLTRFGGGIYNKGFARFYQSAIVNNEASRGQGGGAFNESGATLVIDNTTISGNIGLLGGGGIRNDGGSFQITFGTVAANDPDGLNSTAGGEMVLRNSILSGHTDGNCVGALPGSYGFNIDDGTTCGFIEPSDLVGVDPLLMPLGSYGGPTPIHALDLGSPAIDSADPDRCDGTDQRGVARPQGPRCDRGAYEHDAVGGGSGLPGPTPTSAPTPTLGPTPTLEPTPTPASLSFGQPSFTAGQFYSVYDFCGPTSTTLRVSVSDPAQVASVVLFFRLQDKAGGGTTAWQSVAMNPIGGGVYEYVLPASMISGNSNYPDSYLLYQFVATDSANAVLLRSQVFSDITLTVCHQ